MFVYTLGDIIGIVIAAITFLILGIAWLAMKITGRAENRENRKGKK